MSMITEQVEYLIKLSNKQPFDSNILTLQRACKEAADTIEQLAAKVRAENNKSQPCEDAIRRQEVLDIVDSYSESQSNVEDVAQDIISDIVVLPPVTLQMMDQWKELKETIIEMRDNDGTGTQQEVCKFLANLMDVLEKQMSGSEIPNSSDCIGRQVAIDALYHVDEYNGRSIEAIRNLPSVNPQPKMGRWISDAIQGQIDSQIVKGFICSECGAISVFRMTGGKIVNGDLCPNCGCRMIELQESEVQDADSD